MKLYIRKEKYLKEIRGFYHETDWIKVIPDIRGCENSCLMQTIMEELKETGIPDENITYLNLNKQGCKSIKTPDINQMYTVEGVKYLFIDGIQNVTNLIEVIKAFREEGGYSIFLVGFNAYSLRGNLISRLTGRYSVAFRISQIIPSCGTAIRR